MVIKDIGVAVVGGIRQILYNCSTGDVASAAAINGEVIDRINSFGRLYQTASPLVLAVTSVGSTSTADRRIAFDVKLQHGDSSGGGDMADFSTGFQPSTKTYWTSAPTTALTIWSTGAFRGASPQAFYDLRAAKQYIRPVGTVTKYGPLATATAVGSIDQMYIQMATFLSGADEDPDRQATKDKFGTDATSTI